MDTMTQPDALSRPSEETLVARARAMIPTIAGRAAAARRERRVSEETIRDMEEAGFFRILQPARWGGYEMKPQVFYDVLMALAEGRYVHRLGLWRARRSPLAYGPHGRSCGPRRVG